MPNAATTRTASPAATRTNHPILVLPSWRRAILGDARTFSTQALGDDALASPAMRLLDNARSRDWRTKPGHERQQGLPRRPRHGVSCPPPGTRLEGDMGADRSLFQRHGARLKAAGTELERGVIAAECWRELGRYPAPDGDAWLWDYAGDHAAVVSAATGLSEAYVRCQRKWARRDAEFGQLPREADYGRALRDAGLSHIDARSVLRARGTPTERARDYRVKIRTALAPLYESRAERYVASYLGCSGEVLRKLMRS